MAYLTRSQINVLLKAALTLGFKSPPLALSVDMSNSLTILLPIRFFIANSNIHFQIEWMEYSSAYALTFFPNSRGPNPDRVMVENWDATLPVFERWALAVGAELKEPDPALLLREGGALLERLPADESGDEKFNQHELRLIHESLGGIKRLLVDEVRPSIEQIGAIEQRLEHLERSAKRQEKKDWAFMAVGVVATIVTGLTLSTEQGHQIWAILSNLFASTLLVRLLPVRT